MLIWPATPVGYGAGPGVTVASRLGVNWRADPHTGERNPPPVAALTAALSEALDADDWRDRDAAWVRLGFDASNMDASCYAMIEPAFGSTGFREGLRRALSVWHARS